MAVVRRKIPTAFTLLPEIAEALDELTEAGAFSSNSEFVAHLIRSEWGRRWPGRDLPSITTPPKHANLNDTPPTGGQSDPVRKPTGPVKYSRRKTRIAPAPRRVRDRHQGHRDEVEPGHRAKLDLPGGGGKRRATIRLAPSL